MHQQYMRIPETDFWPLMHYYELMSKDKFKPDLADIHEHIDRGDW